MKYFQSWTWKILLKNKSTDELHLGLSMMGRESVSLNGTEIVNKFSILGGKLNFYLSDQTPASIIVKPDWARSGMPVAELKVDGVVISPTNAPASEVRPTSIFVPAKIPKWGYVFYGLCIAIPIVTLGGAIPALFGVLGVYGCRGILLKPDMNSKMKIFLCTLICVHAWLATYLVLRSITGK